ncbi:MAG: response regulator [Gammaproteobacteria bacterium]|nr:response regulator [Gammaproteobacteria bacterium]
MLCLLLLCACSGALAQPVSVRAEVARQPVAPFTEYYEDPTGRLTIEDVASPEFNVNFIGNVTDDLHFGLTRSTYWIRFNIDWNTSALENIWVLEVGPPKHVEGIARSGADVFVLDATGNHIVRQRFGSYDNPRELKTLTGGFALNLNPATDRQVYLRIETARDLRVPITLWQQSAFRESELIANLALGISYGILLAMIFYNLFLFFSIRESSYFYYVLAIVCQLAFLFLDSKHARYINDSLWINPWLINMAERDIYIFLGITTLQFHRCLLQVWTYNPSLDRLIRGLMAAFVLILPVSLLNDEKVFQSLYLTLIIAAILLVIFTNIDGIRRGIETAKVHLIATSIALLGASVQMSYQVWNLLPSLWITANAYKISLLVHTLLLSFGLAFRYNMLRKEKEHAQWLAIENLRKSDRIKDELLANISHELRTPVYGINGLAEMALRSANNADGNAARTVKHNLELISSSGARLIGLIDNLLDFSAVRHNALPLNLKAVDLRSLVSLVMAINAPMAAEKSLNVINNIPSDLPPVLADEDRLHQVLLNLVSNATKFTDSGEVRISASLVQPDSIRITVSDTGRGISRADQNVIFNAFEKGAGTSDGRGGIGLGLAISRSLVKLHGSDLTVHSEPGKGSHFSFVLPTAEVSRHKLSPTANHLLIRRSDSSLAPMPDGPIEIAASQSAMDKSGKYKARILIVDDESTNRILMTQQLESYTVEQASSGPEAIAAIHRQKPDMILLDLMMPGMNGYETCQTIRKLYSPAELPIVIVTARNHLEDLTHGFQTGANDFLSKPFYAEELIARVSNQLKLVELQRVDLDNARLKDQIAGYVEADQQLRAATQQMQQLLEGISAGIIAFTYPGVITYLNQRAAQYLGGPTDGLRGQLLTRILPAGKANEPVLKILSAWEAGDPIADGGQSLDIEICLPEQVARDANPKLKARFSLLSDDDSTGALILEPIITGTAEAAAHKDDIDILQVLEMAQRHVRNLSSRLKVLTPHELQELPELFERLSGLNATLDLLDKELPSVSVQDDVRQQLVTLMQLTLRTWEATTNKTKIELAEDSNIWVVSIDEGRLRTRTFDRYLRLELLPRIPRWREVVRTTYFVLANPDIEPEARKFLESELNKTKALLHAAAIN